MKEYTLDEWKRMQNQGKKSQPSFNLRKPNEGEDNAQWKKTYLLTKKKEEEEPVEEYEEITYEVSSCYHLFFCYFLFLLPSFFVTFFFCYLNHSSPKYLSQKPARSVPSSDLVCLEWKMKLIVFCA